MLLSATEDTVHMEVSDALAKAKADFESSMDYDLNISGAMGALFELVRNANKLRDEGKLSAADAKPILEFLKDFHAVTGLLPKEKKVHTDEDVIVRIGDEKMRVEAALSERQKARNEKDWARADEIRDALLSQGWEIRDTPEGPVLKKVT